MVLADPPLRVIVGVEPLAVVKPGEGWEARRGMRLKPAAVASACAFGILK
jgi:hypothetical protein